MRRLPLFWIVLGSCSALLNSPDSTSRQAFRTWSLYSTSTDHDNTDAILECFVENASSDLKVKLLSLAASFDRGFGASPRARTMAMEVIEQLERINPQENASRGVDGSTTCPLTGKWRMVWTSAQDVLLLGASPVVTVGAIYQVFEPPVVTNVIDLLPRLQAIFPPNFVPNSLLRAQVTTRASIRSPNRVGLVFERVQLQPVELFGIDIRRIVPPGVDLPKIPGTDAVDSPGFFDVTYQDPELLIIRQNAPGGLFALVRVDTIDP